MADQSKTGGLRHSCIEFILQRYYRTIFFWINPYFELTLLSCIQSKVQLMSKFPQAHHTSISFFFFFLECRDPPETSVSATETFLISLPGRVIGRLREMICWMHLAASKTRATDREEIRQINLD